MNALIARLKEPSTYAGLGGAAMLAGINMEQFQDYAGAVAGLFLFVSIILGERKET